MGSERKQKKQVQYQYQYQVNGIWKESLRRIFGPVKERDGTWRIKTNEESDELIRYKNTINYIKAQRLGWFGYLHQMPDERMVKIVCKWKPVLTRPLGRLKNRWENDIMKWISVLYKVGIGGMRWHSWLSTALQVERSWVQFPMVSLELFIDIILPAALWPWGWLIL
jgi:hypothetical protein